MAMAIGALLQLMQAFCGSIGMARIRALSCGSPISALELRIASLFEGDDRESRQALESTALTWEVELRGFETPDLLHAIHARPVARCRPRSPGGDLTCDDNRPVSPAAAWLLCMLAPNMAPREARSRRLTELPRPGIGGFRL